LLIYGELTIRYFLTVANVH